MVRVVPSSAVDRGIEHRSSQTNEHTIYICCYTANHATLRRKSNDWLAQNQDPMSEWGDMTICGLSEIALYKSN